MNNPIDIEKTRLEKTQNDFKLDVHELRYLKANLIAKPRHTIGKNGLIEVVQTGNPNLYRPLFCLGGQWKDVIPYLNQSQPIYCCNWFIKVQNPKVYIKALAKFYIDEIVSIQGEGPYLILGYCFGGLVATEIAFQLLNQGKETSLLILVERSGSNRKYLRFQPAIRRLIKINQRLLFHLNKLIYLKLDQKLYYISSLVTHLLINTNSEKTNPDKIDKKIEPKLNSIKFNEKEILNSLQQAMSYYDVPHYSGKTVLFFARDSLKTSFIFKKGGWENIFSNIINVYLVEGNHNHLFHEPYAKDIAQKMRLCLEKYARLSGV